jgi:4-amino-4-deoxy-L-arabinose transferase-like glycosyltransferase
MNLIDTNPRDSAETASATDSAPETANARSRRLIPWMLGLMLLLGIALLRITSIYHVFNHTIDEGSHVACGVQWLEKGVYRYDLIDTPLPRISVAILPYLAGVRGFGKSNYFEEGALELATGGHYWRILTLARIAVLPYFVLATVVIFFWTRRIYGYPAALLAAGIFTMMPVVLAHSAVATTDIIFTSFFLTAVYAFTCWLSAPSLRNAVVLGLTAGLGAASKLSMLVYFPLTVALTLVLYFSSTNGAEIPRNQEQQRRWGPRSVRGALSSVAVLLVCAFLVVWATYRFSHAPLSEFSSAPDKLASKVFGSSSSLASGVHLLTTKLQLPAPEYYDGIRFLRDQNQLGRRSYLFGRVKNGGWWYFYIVSLGLKTPIAILILVVIGSVSLARNWLRTRVDWQRLVPLAGVLALLLATLASRINIGVRHVMPIFGFFSMLAAWGVVSLWNSGSRAARESRSRSRMPWWAGRAAAVVLLSWFVVSSARSHPDYLAYFNEFGGNNPANLLLASDLDWGQDLTRLASYLHEQQAGQVSVLYMVAFEPSSLDLPNGVQLHCGEAATGWVAIEERYARTYPECVQWLGSEPMHAYVGKTMRVYYLPSKAASQP